MVAVRNPHGPLTSTRRMRTLRPPRPYLPAWSYANTGYSAMKVVNSFKSAKRRHKDCRVVRRKGRVYVINKTNPRFKARQG